MENNQPKIMSFARRDRLLDIEKQIRTLWDKNNIYECNVNDQKPKYMVTFPYPYMNGRLHLGHAFSLSKAEFMSRFKRHKGYNSLFPQAYHCTGMPIQAAAQKLKEEFSEKGIEKLRQIKSERDIAFQKQQPYDAPMTQYEILLNCSVPEEELSKFFDPYYWLDYFPEKSQNDLKLFGAAIDHRRAFITTTKNPYYNSFIEWQFNTLKANGVIKFGKRPSIYSSKDKEICADHERATGEGVGPQEYTLIKIEVNDDKKEVIFGTSEKIFLVAATLRPETMYGQTNCFILPDGEYGLYKMKQGELWVCSPHSARNMSYQLLTEEWGISNKVKDIKGQDMIGLKLKAPLTSYENIYVWPMLSIDMKKGTGVVTSVPSDAPDDYAVLVDLQKKQPLREKFGLTDEMVLPYKPISIINVPNYSELSAVTAYDHFKIKSMNDKQKLLDAKAEVYLKGFYKGIMKVGTHQGKTVEQAKKLIKAELIQLGQAAPYYEPEEQVVSRSGDECVVAMCDQWYIDYGREEHKNFLKKYVLSGKFNNYNETLTKCYEDALDWLGEWGCSRSFGLGTFLPWDKQYVIESLSDSTIYMSYYTIAHLLQKDMNGEQPGELGINSQDISHFDWDYVFLGKNRDENSKISEEKLNELRKSFNYWYPFDLRCSGKDLIKNHLTMCLYNHYYIWGEQYLPKGIFCNGWVMVNGEKMSKSQGNFFTVEQFCTKYSSDATRLCLAFAGDSVENSNVNESDANSYILKLSQLENVFEEISSNFTQLRNETVNETEYFDTVFENEIKNIVNICEQSYDVLLMRTVVINGFFKMLNIREEYKQSCGTNNIKKDLIKLWMHSFLVCLSPVIPHFCEFMWQNHYKKVLSEEESKQISEFLINEPFPHFEQSQIDYLILKKNEQLIKVGQHLRSTYEKFKQKNKKIIKKIYIICTDEYQPWEVKVLTKLRQCLKENKNWQEEIKEDFKDDKNLVKKAMSFAKFKLEEQQELGEEALNDQVEFSEFKLLCDNLERITKGMVNKDQVEVILSSDCDKSDVKSVKTAKEHVRPRNPIIIIDF